MSRILEIKESTFIKISLGMIGILTALIFKSGQAYNRLENVEEVVLRLSASVETCLTSCRRTPLSSETILRNP